MQLSEECLSSVWEALSSISSTGRQEKGLCLSVSLDRMQTPWSWLCVSAEVTSVLPLGQDGDQHGPALSLNGKVSNGCLAAGEDEAEL